jgi:ABC-type enterobactin transport system permease subunit
VSVSDPVIVTETFSGTLTKNGAVTHQFFTAATGLVTATLTSLGEAPPEIVGFSMGTMSGSTCSIVLANDQAVVTSVLTGTVSTLQGALCVRIYDVGKLSGPVDYVFTVTHP